MREIELTFQKNIRDLGGLVGYQGKKVKYNRLFRGGFLDKITPEDAEILKTLNLTDVIDFRSDLEFNNRPDYRLEGVIYHSFPPMQDHLKDEDKEMADSNLLWFVSPDKTGHEHMLLVYRDILESEMGITAYRNFFNTLLSKDDGVFYFHCSQGKDRAGLAAAMVEFALGVDIEDIKKDYLLTNKAMEIRLEYLIGKVKHRPYYNERYHASMVDVFSAKEEYFNEAMKTMNELAGSPLEYIKKVLQVDIDKLREIYLE